MVNLWQVTLSAAGGMFVALISVSLGALLAGRNQRVHWVRSAQIEYVAELLSAYSYIYNEFYRWAKTGTRPDTDWARWNSALAKLSLAGDPTIFQAALVIDGLFWATTDEFKSGAIDRESWPQRRTILEESHVNLINHCRLKLGTFREPISSTIARDVRAEIENVAPGMDAEVSQRSAEATGSSEVNTSYRLYGHSQRDGSTPERPTRPTRSAVEGQTLGDMDESGDKSVAVPDDAARVYERIINQAHDHWHEFSVIVASANVALALLLAGRIITAGRTGNVGFLAVLIAIAAVVAAALAYYSIQIGALFVFGSLRLVDVVLSFGIAATQLALFIWPTHALNATGQTGPEVFRNLRHWLLFYAAFVLVGTLANRNAAASRARRSFVNDRYERQQAFDAKFAYVSFSLVLVCWLLSWPWLRGAVFVGVIIAIAGTMLGILSQARIARRLAEQDTATTEGPVLMRR